MGPQFSDNKTTGSYMNSSVGWTPCFSTTTGFCCIGQFIFLETYVLFSWRYCYWRRAEMWYIHVVECFIESSEWALMRIWPKLSNKRYWTLLYAFFHFTVHDLTGCCSQPFLIALSKKRNSDSRTRPIIFVWWIWQWICESFRIGSGTDSNTLTLEKKCLRFAYNASEKAWMWNEFMVQYTIEIS